MISLIFTALIGSVAFVLKYLQTDLTNSLYAIFQVAAYGEALFSLFTAYFMRKNIQKCFYAFRDFYSMICEFFIVSPFDEFKNFIF